MICWLHLEWELHTIFTPVQIQAKFVNLRNSQKFPWHQHIHLCSNCCKLVCTCLFFWTCWRLYTKVCTRILTMNIGLTLSFIFHVSAIHQLWITIDLFKNRRWMFTINLSDIIWQQPQKKPCYRCVYTANNE